MTYSKIVWNIFLVNFYEWKTRCFKSWKMFVFHSIGDVTITGEGLQILTYTRHSWSLSSEGSLTCHTYCDTGLPFIMVIRTRDTHTCYRAFGSGAVTTFFNDLGLSRPGIEPRSPACDANALQLRHRGVCKILK